MTLYKPRRLRTWDLDVCEHHFGFLDGSLEPNTYTEKKIHALLIHEDTHSDRILNQPVLLRWFWLIRYQFSRSFRWEEEKIAYRAEFEKLVEYGVPIPFESYASSLSGPVYFGMVPFEDALHWVRKTVTSMGDVEYAVSCLEADQWIRQRRRLVESTGDSQVLKPSTPPAPLQYDRYWLADRLALLASGISVFVIVMLVTLVSNFLSRE